MCVATDGLVVVAGFQSPSSSDKRLAVSMKRLNGFGNTVAETFGAAISIAAFPGWMGIHAVFSEGLRDGCLRPDLYRCSLGLEECLQRAAKGISAGRQDGYLQPGL